MYVTLLGSISVVSEITVKIENVKYHIYLDSLEKVDGILKFINE